MNKYINTEQIEQYLHREEHGTPDERWRPESEFARIIDCIPSADVRENKHGEWKKGKYETDCICSQCNTEYAMPRETNFCPNCGADMRERKETNE